MLPARPSYKTPIIEVLIDGINSDRVSHIKYALLARLPTYRFLGATSAVLQLRKLSTKPLKKCCHFIKFQILIFSGIGDRVK